GPDAELRHSDIVGLGGLRTKGHAAVPDVVAVVANKKEEKDIRMAASRSLQMIGNCEEAVRAIPALLKVLNDKNEHKRVRERILWALRVHGTKSLSQNEAVCDALKNVMLEPGLDDGGQGEGGKMLRYDSAYLLCRIKQTKAPEEAFKVLLDFLKDSHIRIYKGLETGTSTVKEGGGGTGNVSEVILSDGRIMALQAL